MAHLSFEQRRRVALTGISAILLLLPQAFGGAALNAQAAALVGLAVIALILRRELNEGAYGVVGWALLAVWLSALLSLIPLPVAWARVISPSLVGLHETVPEMPATLRLSLDPQASWRGLGRLAIGAMAISLAAALRPGTRETRWLLVTVAILALTQIAYALIMALTVGSQVWGWRNLRHAQELCGTYDAPQPFRGLVLLACIPCLAMVSLSRKRDQPGHALKVRALRLLERRGPITAMLGGLTATLCAFVIGLERSPRTLAPLGLGLLMFWGLERLRSGRDRSGVVLAALIAMGAGCAVGPQLQPALTSAQPRWAEGARVVEAYPWTGAGLGAVAHELGASNADVRPQSLRADALELAAELGLPAAAIGLLAALGLLWSAVRADIGSAHRDRRLLIHALSAALLIAIVRSALGGELGWAANVLMLGLLAGFLAGLVRPAGAISSGPPLAIMLPILGVASLALRPPDSAALTQIDGELRAIHLEQAWVRDLTVERLAPAELRPAIRGRVGSIIASRPNERLRALQRSAIPALQAALRQTPGDGRLHARLAYQLALTAGSPARIDHHAEMARRRCPGRPRWVAESYLAQLPHRPAAGRQLGPLLEQHAHLRAPIIERAARLDQLAAVADLLPASASHSRAKAATLALALAQPGAARRILAKLPINGTYTRHPKGTRTLRCEARSDHPQLAALCTRTHLLAVIELSPDWTPIEVPHIAAFDPLELRINPLSACYPVELDSPLRGQLRRVRVD